MTSCDDTSHFQPQQEQEQQEWEILKEQENERLQETE